MPYEDPLHPLSSTAAPAPQGAALPPAQGGVPFSPAEMRTLTGQGHSAPASMPEFQPASMPEPRPASMPEPQPPTFDLDALGRQVREQLGALGTREALDEAMQEIAPREPVSPVGEENRTVPAPEPERPPMIEVGQVLRMTPEERVRAGVTDGAYRAAKEAVRAREGARRTATDRLRARLSGGTSAPGRRLTAEEAEKDPATIRFGTLEEIDAEAPALW